MHFERININLIKIIISVQTEVKVLKFTDFNENDKDCMD